MKRKAKKRIKTSSGAKAHKIGDKHFIDGTACVVRFVNAGSAWVSPELDDPESPGISRHIVFARISPMGKVTLL